MHSNVLKNLPSWFSLRCIHSPEIFLQHHFSLLHPQNMYLVNLCFYKQMSLGGAEPNEL